MEKYMEKNSNWRESFDKRNGTRDMLRAMVVALFSIGLTIGALSISLVDTLANEPGRIITINYELIDEMVTLDPVLGAGESLLITIPQTDQFEPHSMRLAEVKGDVPPFVPKLFVSSGIVKNLGYLLADNQLRNWACEPIPGSIGKNSYQISCK